MKSFDELAALRDSLQRRARAEEAERQRLRQLEERRRQEAGLFRRAVGDAVPLEPHGRADVRPSAAPPHPLQRELDERAALEESLSDEIDVERLLDTDEQLSFHRAHVGRDVVARLRRGQWVVQGQIDLHGLRVDEAREALGAFIANALKRQQRCLRVIHGKGLGSVRRKPVLKGKVPRWLVQRDEVLAFCQAPPNDGGSGALLVLLRGA